MDISKNKIEQIKYPAYAEVKLDGECIVFKDGNVFNDYGRDRSAWIDTSHLPTGCVLAGEVYTHEGKEYFSELHSHRDDKTPKHIAWFDYILYGVEEQYQVRRKRLMTSGLPCVEGCVVTNNKEVQEYLKYIISKGYEGIVVKPAYDVTPNNWVKLKREFTCNLYVRGIRKKTTGGSKSSVAVGTASHIYGCCSVIGWLPLVEMIMKEDIIGEDNDYWFIEPKIKIEVAYINVIQGNGKLRNPRIKRIRNFDAEVKDVSNTM